VVSGGNGQWLGIFQEADVAAAVAAAFASYQQHMDQVRLRWAVCDVVDELDILEAWKEALGWSRSGALAMSE